MNNVNISASKLRKAAVITERMQSLQEELAKIWSQSAGVLPAIAPKRGRKKMSAASRENIRAAQKARWAKTKKIGSFS